MWFEDWRWEVKDSRSEGEVLDGAEEAILDMMVKDAYAVGLRLLL